MKFYTLRFGDGLLGARQGRLQSGRQTHEQPEIPWQHDAKPNGGPTDDHVFEAVLPAMVALQREGCLSTWAGVRFQMTAWQLRASPPFSRSVLCVLDNLSKLLQKTELELKK